MKQLSQKDKLLKALNIDSKGKKENNKIGKTNKNTYNTKGNVNLRANNRKSQ